MQSSSPSSTPAAPAVRSWRRPLEVIVVAAVLIALVAIGLGDYRATRRDSAALTCRSNMRAIMHQATIYAGDYGLAEASLGVDRLLQAGMVTERTGHCPLGRGNGRDYIVTIREGRPVGIVCTVDPREHVWVPESP